MTVQRYFLIFVVLFYGILLANVSSQVIESDDGSAFDTSSSGSNQAPLPTPIVTLTSIQPSPVTTAPPKSSNADTPQPQRSVAPSGVPSNPKTSAPHIPTPSSKLRGSTSTDDEDNATEPLPPKSSEVDASTPNPTSTAPESSAKQEDEQKEAKQDGANDNTSTKMITTVLICIVVGGIAVVAIRHFPKKFQKSQRTSKTITEVEEVGSPINSPIYVRQHVFQI